MIRTQISLDDEQRDALDRAAARSGRSMSSLIRDAIDVVYGTRDDPASDLEAMRSARGAWRDHPSDGAAWVDTLRSGSRLGDLTRASVPSDEASTPRQP